MMRLKRFLVLTFFFVKIISAQASDLDSKTKCEELLVSRVVGAYSRLIDQLMIRPEIVEELSNLVREPSASFDSFFKFKFSNSEVIPAFRALDRLKKMVLEQRFDFQRLTPELFSVIRAKLEVASQKQKEVFEKSSEVAQIARLVRVLPQTPGTAYRSFFSPDLRMRIDSMFTADQTVAFDLESGQQLGILNGAKYRIEDVVFSPDMSRFLTRSGDDLLILWDAKTFRKIATLPFLGSSKNFVFINHGKNFAVSRRGMKRVVIYDAIQGREVDSFTLGFDSPVEAIDVVPGKETLVLFLSGGAVSLYDLKLRKVQLLKSARSGSAVIRSEFSPSGNLLLSVYLSGLHFVAEVIDLKNDRVLSSREYYQTELSSCLLSDSFLILGFKSGKLEYQDLSTGVLSPSVLLRSSFAGAFSKLILSAPRVNEFFELSSFGKVNVWQISPFRLLYELDVIKLNVSFFGTNSNHDAIVVEGVGRQIVAVDLSEISKEVLFSK